MDTIQGKVSNVRFSAKTHHKQTSISTRQTTLLELDGKAIEIQLNDPVVILDGDFVVMTGKKKNGHFKVVAYANKSNGFSGGQDPTLSYMIGGVCMLTGVFFAGTLSGLAIAGIGLGLMYHGSRHKKAITLVEQMAFA